MRFAAWPNVVLELSVNRRTAMRSRAFRRHHEERIKRRVRRYYGGYAAERPRHLGRIAHSRQPCSCWMCGNPRRHVGERTLQEEAFVGIGYRF